MQIFADKKFENPIEVIKAFDKNSFIEAFAKIEAYKNTHYLLGYVRYEAKDIFLGEKVESKKPLLHFEVFENYQNYTPESASALRLEKTAQIDYATYKKAINQIKKEISNGNTYQVNYTYDWQVNTDVEGIALYESILENQKTPYNSYIKNEFEEILSFSPELFFELEGNKIKTKPMKGTIQRGKTEIEDKKNIEFLQNDIKNRAENVMIVDLLRNDLGKIAKTGTVKVEKLFEVETHKTVHQMTSEVIAELEDNISMYDIFKALFPCGSVTGAPKINTMKIINELEVGKRNIYCGAIGLISPEKTVFSVPIRILQRSFSCNCENDNCGIINARNATCHCERSEAIQETPSYQCRVGGAIVWDSTAKEEWQETFTKIQFLNSTIYHCEAQAEAIQNISIESPRNFAPSNDVKIIETMLVEQKKMSYKKEHFERLKNSARILGFKFNPNILNILPENNGMLRILLSQAGTFETQYLKIEPIKTNKISISKTPANSKEPLLYHKTTYRPWYEKSMEKIKSGEIFDEVFFNEKGELTEGARTNIILQIEGKLYTPPVECGLLNGVLRQKILGTKTSRIRFGIHPECKNAKMLKQFQQDSFREINEKILYLDDLKKAEKIFCINSVRGIVEVKL